MPQEQVVVVIEDDPQISQFVVSALEGDGFKVYTAPSGDRGLVEAGNRRPDLLVIDLGLPDIDGIDVIRQVRGWSEVPILVLSARVDETDKVLALDTGADDYLTKPFGVAELLARARALTRRRRSGAASGPVISFGSVTVDFSTREITRDGEPVHLTPIEYRLLSVLAASAGKVLTHKYLMQEVWGPNQTESGHYLRIYISHLRHKLEADPAQPQHFLTETGVGYRFKI